MILDQIPAAIHTLDALMQAPNPQKPLEAMIILASLRAAPRPGISATDASLERQKARDLFDHVLRTLDGIGCNEYVHQRAIACFGDDVDMYVEIARLWQDDLDLEKMRNIMQRAVGVAESKGQPDSRLLNNAAVLRHLGGDLAEARTLYEGALTTASNLDSAVAESISTTVLYNLARVYEAQGETVLAKEAYEKLLARHPEYVDGALKFAFFF